MIFLRLLGIGALYGLGFMIVKSLFPEPFALLLLQGGGQSSEGNLTTLALVYMASGLIAGLIAGPLFGALLLARRGRNPDAPSASRFTLSLALALMMGVISGVLIMLAYVTGILPTGGVLDPLKLIRASIHSAPGIALLVAWTIARDILPAGLAGLLLSPVGGGFLTRLYGSERQPVQKSYDEFEAG